jgi:excisionase family DNA binding protein
MAKQASTAPQPRGFLSPKWEGRDTLTIMEAAEILGISRWAAYDAANRGKLPTVRLNRKWIIPRRALEKLLGAA